jgi:hypothetical protein
MQAESILDDIKAFPLPPKLYRLYSDYPEEGAPTTLLPCGLLPPRPPPIPEKFTVFGATLSSSGSGFESLPPCCSFPAAPELAQMVYELSLGETRAQSDCDALREINDAFFCGVLQLFEIFALHQATLNEADAKSKSELAAHSLQALVLQALRILNLRRVRVDAAEGVVRLAEEQIVEDLTAAQTCEQLIAAAGIQLSPVADDSGIE